MRDISKLLPPGTQMLEHQTADMTCFKNELIIVSYLDPRLVDDPSVTDNELAIDILRRWRMILLQKAQELADKMTDLT